MSNAGAIKAGQVAVEVAIANVNESVGDVKKFAKELVDLGNKAEKTKRKSFGLIKALVAFNVVQRNFAKISKFFNDSLEAVDRVGKASKRLGLTTKEFQNLSQAAQFSGASVEQFETAFSAMSRNISQFMMGTGEAKQAFEMMGIGTADLAGKSQLERMKLISDALAQYTDHAQKAGLAMKIFGEGGVRILPMLAEGSAVLDRLTAASERMSGSIKGDAIVSFENLNDLLAAWNHRISNTSTNILSVFVPSLQALLISTIAVANTFDRIEHSSLAVFDDIKNKTEKASFWTRQMMYLWAGIEFTIRATNSAIYGTHSALKLLESGAFKVAAAISEMMGAATGSEEFKTAANVYRDSAKAAWYEAVQLNAKLRNEFQDMWGATVAGMADAMVETAAIESVFEQMTQAMAESRDLMAQMEEQQRQERIEAEKSAKAKQAQARALNLSNAFSGASIRAGTLAGAQTVREMRNQQTQERLLREIRDQLKDAAVVEGV